MSQKLFNKTMNIVENAARGKFPLSSKINIEELKYSELIQRVKLQKSADTKFMKKIRAEIDAGNLMELFMQYNDSFDYDVIRYKGMS